jgi:hypothetical protein
VANHIFPTHLVNLIGHIGSAEAVGSTCSIAEVDGSLSKPSLSACNIISDIDCWEFIFADWICFSILFKDLFQLLMCLFVDFIARCINK